MTVMYGRWMYCMLNVCVKSLAHDPNGLKEETSPHPLCVGLHAVVTVAERRVCRLGD